MFQRPKPRFEADATALAALRHVHPAPNSFRVHFGAIASGDEADQRRAVGAEGIGQPGQISTPKASATEPSQPSRAAWLWQWP